MVLAHVALSSSNLRSLLHSVKHATIPSASASVGTTDAPEDFTRQPPSSPPPRPDRSAVEPASIHTRASDGSASSWASTASTRPHPSTCHGRGSISTASSSSSVEEAISRTSSPVPDAVTAPPANHKMHQTSSRLLRMTDEDRPFTRDFMDLFATLMVSLPLGSHRVRFQRVEHTFTSEEAINNLGSLKFSQSNRMPDPKDPSRIVTTTTTTTFSMAREMARSVCQRFMDARFVESADSKPTPVFALKGGVWQLTPKGLHILGRFCQRNGINQRHVVDAIDSPRNGMNLVNLERDAVTDKLSMERATVEVVFRRFIGPDGPNAKPTTYSADSDSLSDYHNGMVGVKMARERRVGDRWWRHTFTGKATTDWLMDCSTTIDRKETHDLAIQFVRQGLMLAIVEDRSYAHDHRPVAADFQPTKAALYALTDKGQRVAGWISRDKVVVDDVVTVATAAAPLAPVAPRTADGKTTGRDSNTNRLTAILADPALRLLYREFVRDTLCEENLSFYLDVVEFTSNYRHAVQRTPAPKMETIRETLAAAYGLYNAFLAPGSPCELNIDHNLRNNLASRMTRAVGDDDSMLGSLRQVATLFEEAQNSVFKLMASDSVPKFLKDSKYSSMLREHDFDGAALSTRNDPVAAPERTASKLIR